MFPGGGLTTEPRFPRAIPYVIGIAVVAVPVVLLGAAEWQIVAGVALAWAMLLTSAIVLWRRSQPLPKLERQGWTWVSAGLMLASIGMLVSIAESTFEGASLRFGFADIFFLSASICGMVGVVHLPHGPGLKGLRVQSLLDGWIAGVAVAVVLWVFLVADIVADAPGSSFQAILGRLYPVVDLIVLCTVVTVTVRRAAYRLDPRLLALAAGLAIQAIVDLIYLDATRSETILTGEPDRLIVGLSLIAVAALATAAVLPDQRMELQIRRAQPSGPLTAFPYVVVAALVIVLGIEAGTDLSIVQDARSLEYSMGVALVVLLLLVRQAVAIRENRVALESHRRELVASISHEVRTPVTAILAALELLESNRTHLPDHEQAELSGIALEQTRYMARMIEDLILLARNTTSGLKLRMKTVAIDSIVDAAIADVEHDGIERRGLTGITLTADPDRLRQALGNFLSNAVQYGQGSCIVDVGMAGRSLRIDVHDDGPGVPYRFREVIWEHFERGSHRLNSQIQGSGIGLAVVQLVATAHGGLVEYRRSDVLGGACFTLLLPLDQG